MAKPTDLNTERSIESLAAASALQFALLSSLLKTLASDGRLSKHDLVLIFSTTDFKLSEAARAIEGLGKESIERAAARALGTMRDLAKDLGLTPPQSS